MAQHIYPSLLDLIGKTPLARLNVDSPATVLAKLEFLSPGGSIKDRSALYMIEEAERAGKLRPGGTIVEATSGNQGIALAMIGAIKGYRVVITVPDRVAAEKIAILRAYGAEVHICPNTASHEDPRGYHARAEQILHTTADAFMPDQYFNKSNADAHYHSTGPDIWEQTHGSVTHVIVGAGTCGTISGVGRYLKEKNPNIKIMGVDSVNSFYSNPVPQEYNVEGLGIDVISETFDQSVVDKIFTITDEDAFTATRRAAKQYGLMVGISGGAVLHIAEQFAKTLTADNVLVTIMADSGRAYLSKIFMQQETPLPQQSTVKTIQAA